MSGALWCFFFGWQSFFQLSENDTSVHDCPYGQARECPYRQGLQEIPHLLRAFLTAKIIQASGLCDRLISNDRTYRGPELRD